MRSSFYCVNLETKTCLTGPGAVRSPTGESFDLIRKSKENKVFQDFHNKMSSAQVSMILFEFIHSLNNFPEPDAAYGAWERCASGGLCSPLWREVGPETVT